MPITALIASLFSPATDLLKKIISKDEDKTEALAKLQEVQSKIVDTVVQLEKEKYNLMKAEVTSSNWITSAWRPIASLLIVIIAILSSFGLANPDAHFWDLAQAFLGIYAGSRGVEKIAGSIIKK